MATISNNTLTPVQRARRADGDCVCEVCDKPYSEHEWDRRFPISLSLWKNPIRPAYAYRKLCNGDLVKL